MMPFTRTSVFANLPSMILVVLIEVHPGVEARDLIGVAVEHQRRAAPVLTDALLGRLRPPRVIVMRIDVRVEAVLARRALVPRRRRLLVGERDLDDRLDALEAVLPRHDKLHRRAVLRRQLLSVETGSEDRERMHGLVDAQALDVRPL